MVSGPPDGRPVPPVTRALGVRKDTSRRPSDESPWSKMKTIVTVKKPEVTGKQLGVGALRDLYRRSQPSLHPRNVPVRWGSAAALGAEMRDLNAFKKYRCCKLTGTPVEGCCPSFRKLYLVKNEPIICVSEGGEIRGSE